jgi:hypothetical protein
MFAVDPPKTLADKKDGNHKGPSAPKRKKLLMPCGVKIVGYLIVRRACARNFLPSIPCDSFALAK